MYARPHIHQMLTNLSPRPLELTAGDEIVAMENIDILHSNGFEVNVDEDKAPGRGERISLTAMPVSKETTFDFKGQLFRDASSCRQKADTSQISSNCCTSYPMVRGPRDKWSDVRRLALCSPCEHVGRAS